MGLNPYKDLKERVARSSQGVLGLLGIGSLQVWYLKAPTMLETFAAQACAVRTGFSEGSRHRHAGGNGDGARARMRTRMTSRGRDTRTRPKIRDVRNASVRSSYG